MKTLPHLVAASLMGLLASLATSAQARDSLNWSVGVSTPGAVVSVSNAPTVMLPAPVYAPVLVPARPVYMAAPMVVHAPPVYVVREGKHHGKGWHKKHGHGHQGVGRGEHGGYYQSGAHGAPVVMMQASPHVWMR